MRRLFPLLLLFLLLVPAGALADTRLMVVSDLHYLAPSLYAGSELFLEAVSRGDGKVPQYSAELLKALVLETAHQKPDALILTGDLTFNGEKTSHETLAQGLREIVESGTPVYVIPGNHDILMANARAFSGWTFSPTPSVTPAEFAEIWADFMPGYASASADPGFSFAVPVGDSVWLAMNDVSYYRTVQQPFGLYTSAHDAWFREALQQAEGRTIITAAHQSLIPHTDVLIKSMCIYGADAMLTAMREAGAHLILTGHLHLQHIASADGVTDIATSAFCLYPHRYGMVTVSDDGTVSYEGCALCKEHLPEGLQEASASWYAYAYRRQHTAAVEAMAEDPAERESMLDFGIRLNMAYFSGTFRSDDPSWRSEPGYALWLAHRSENSFASYLSSLFDMSPTDCLHWSFRP